MISLMFFEVILQKLTKFQRFQSKGKQFSLDDIAVQAQKPSWLVRLMAVVRVVSQRLGKLSAANRATVLLVDKRLFDHVGRETAAVSSSIVVSSHPESRVGHVAFFQNVSGAFFRRFGFCVGSSFRNTARSHVDFLSRNFALWSGVISAPRFASALLSFGRRVFSTQTLKDLFSILRVIPSLVLAVAGLVLGVVRTSRVPHLVSILLNPALFVRHPFGDVDRPLLRGALRFNLRHRTSYQLCVMG